MPEDKKWHTKGHCAHLLEAYRQLKVLWDIRSNSTTSRTSITTHSLLDIYLSHIRKMAITIRFSPNVTIRIPAEAKSASPIHKASQKSTGTSKKDKRKVQLEALLKQAIETKSTMATWIEKCEREREVRSKAEAKEQAQQPRLLLRLHNHPRPVLYFPPAG